MFEAEHMHRQGVSCLSLPAGILHPAAASSFLLLIRDTSNRVQ